MKALIMKARFLRDERGFTLTEMMVTLVIWIAVLFALYNIFDMSIRVFSFGNNKVEATESARAGIDTMEREIRQAYPVEPNTLFHIWDPTEIRFGRNLNSDDDIQKIGYVVYEDPAGSGKFLLGRDNISTGTTNTVENLQPVVEHMDYQSPTNTGLSFTYCRRLQDDSDLDDPDDCPAGFDVATSEGDIILVRMQLRLRVHKGLKDATQTLTTDVALRSRGGL
jgi:prepilin-type N-terminal cleavage/methylation domain-containing protein